VAACDTAELAEVDVMIEDVACEEDGSEEEDVNELAVEVATLEDTLEEVEDALGSIAEEGVILVEGELVERTSEDKEDELSSSVEDLGGGVVEPSVVERVGVGVGVEDEDWIIDDTLPAASAFTIAAPRVGRGTSPLTCQPPVARGQAGMLKLGEYAPSLTPAGLTLLHSFLRLSKSG